MSAQIIDGKAVAAEVKTEIAAQVKTFVDKGHRAPALAVVLVGDDAASAVYVRNKKNACEAVGIRSEAYELPSATAEADIIALVEKLNADENIDGILVQLPLPQHIDEDKVVLTIRADKDVDGFHPFNMARLVQKQPNLRPCTPYGCIRLLESTGQTIAGKNAVVVGASNIVGRPMALELLLANATTTICNSKTQDLPGEVARADIVVVGVGIPEFVKGAWIKPGATVIDVGINRTDAGTLVGDVEFDAAAERAAYITPVPGGVGPMTVAMLMRNTFTAYASTRS